MDPMGKRTLKQRLIQRFQRWHVGTQKREVEKGINAAALETITIEREGLLDERGLTLGKRRSDEDMIVAFPQTPLA